MLFGKRILQIYSINLYIFLIIHPLEKHKITLWDFISSEGVETIFILFADSGPEVFFDSLTILWVMDFVT